MKLLDRSAARTHLAALACYLALALVITFPMPLRLGQQIIANGPGQVDGYLGIWNIWWTARALTGGQDPYVTPLLFHPQGLDLFWQTLSLPNGLLALPFTLALGPLPAYNLLIIASYVLGGYSAFLFIRWALARDAWAEAGPPSGGNDLAALVGGALYAVAPFHTQKVLDAQLEVASIQWLPLGLLAVHALLERPSWRRAVLAGVALLVVGMGTWYYGLFVLIYAGMAAGLWALRPAPLADGRLPWPRRLRAALDWRLVLWGAAPLVLWLVLMAPRLLSLIQTGDELLGDARVEQYDAAADLLAFWLPSPLHPLWGEAVSRAYLAWHPEAILWNVSLGLVCIGLGLVGARSAWPRAWRWGALCIVTAVLAMGAELSVMGREPGLPLLYSLIKDLPGVRASHRPNHFVLITILLAALFAAHGARRLLAGRRPAARPALAGALVAAALAVDGWAGPMPMFERPMPAPYRAMPAPDGALLPVPLHLNFSNSENLWYQTAHGWPIVGGFIGREPPYPLGDFAPGVRELRFGRYEPDDILSPGWPELARESLAANDIRYVMFHRRTMGSSLPAMTELVGAMGLTASYEDELIGVYPVPAPERPRPLAYLGAGWGPVERSPDARWRWMGAEAQIRLLNPTGAARPIRLTLDLESYERARTLTIRLGDGGPASLAISRARMQRTLHLILPPGEHVLYLGAPADEAPGRQSGPISLAFMGITIE